MITIVLPTANDACLLADACGLWAARLAPTGPTATRLHALQKMLLEHAKGYTEGHAMIDGVGESPTADKGPIGSCSPIAPPSCPACGNDYCDGRCEGEP